MFAAGKSSLHRLSFRSLPTENGAAPRKTVLPSEKSGIAVALYESEGNLFTTRVPGSLPYGVCPFREARHGPEINLELYEVFRALH